jgi:hypothetical protein
LFQGILFLHGDSFYSLFYTVTVLCH